MSSKTVYFNIVDQEFPAGTVPTGFTMTLSGPPTFTPQTIVSGVPNAAFNNVDVPGTYTCTCERNGVSATPVTFEVIPPPIMIAVPTTGTVA